MAIRMPSSNVEDRFLFTRKEGIDESIYRKLKKVLTGHEGTIHISVHAKEQMNKRGYNKCDIALAIYNGKVVEKQYGKDLKMVIAGFDQSCNPIVIVVAGKGGMTLKS